MDKIDYLKMELIKIYGNRIHIYKVKQYQDGDISCNIPENQKEILDIDICCNDNYACIFNNMIRKEYQSFTRTNSISGLKWEDLNSKVTEEKSIISLFKHINTKEGKKDTKILIMKIDTLFECKDLLYELLEFSSDDKDCPNEIRNNPRYDYNRKKHTVEAWNRSYYFKRKVLENYNYQCAICRCKEIKILQGCHIVPVSEHGSDDLSNGICLCANHHLMLDKEIIKIDPNKYELISANDSVKQMPWYNEFKEKYHFKLVKPNNKK